ncbi:FxsA family protein [Colwelliaceae bacterium 6471]
MFRLLFLLFVIVPIIEISVLMQVGEWLGAWPTVFIVIITAWLGAKNVQRQGVATLNSVQNKMAQGQMPSDEIVAGLLLLVAGVTLITPGFVTDAFGLLLLVPQLRAALVKAIQKRLVVSQMGAASFTHQHFEQSPINDNDFHDGSKDNSTQHQGKVLDGEFERKD